MSEKVKTCEICKGEFVQRQHNHKFCSQSCKSKAKQIRDKHRSLMGLTWEREGNCVTCGGAMQRRVHNQCYCSPECADAGSSFNARAKRAQRKEERTQRLSPFLRLEDWRFKFTELEIIYLAELNRGYGIKEFSKTLFGEKNSGSRTVVMLLALFEAVEEETGVDLAEHLDDPSAMTLYSNAEWADKQRAEGKMQIQRPRGYGRKGPSLGLSKNPSTVKGKFGVKASPEFNWGVLGPRVWQGSGPRDTNEHRDE